ncbi:hypothetical protein [Arenibacter lacus]|nr:hypothetical protein [Arenibacter lacus]
MIYGKPIGQTFEDLLVPMMKNMLGSYLVGSIGNASFGYGY